MAERLIPCGFVWNTMCKIFFTYVFAIIILVLSVAPMGLLLLDIIMLQGFRASHSTTCLNPHQPYGLLRLPN